MTKEKGTERAGKDIKEIIPQAPPAIRPLFLSYSFFLNHSRDAVRIAAREEREREAFLRRSEKGKRKRRKGMVKAQQRRISFHQSLYSLAATLSFPIIVFLFLLSQPHFLHFPFMIPILFLFPISSALLSLSNPFSSSLGALALEE